MKRIPDPIYVAEASLFSKTVDALAKEHLLAVDTESNSLFAYREQVCLIQFSTPSRDYLIDPLALEDISALGGIFADEKIEKIFHAAEYDLLCLKRDFKFTFANIFDTMMAARICGMERVGLGNVLEATFGVRLEKKFQKADWGKRPLPMDMRSYARMDTHYLIGLRNRLLEELEANDRRNIADEDFRRLAQVNGTPPGPIEVDVWRFNGAKYLTSRQAAVLQELARYRDQRAQKENRPPFKVIGDKVLLEIAIHTPMNIIELSSLATVPEKITNRHGKGLVAAVLAGVASKGIKPPAREYHNDGYPDRLEALKEWRKTKAMGMGVESDVVLPRDIMLAIAAENPRSQAKLAKIMESTPWRYQQYGNQIQKTIQSLQGD